MEVLKNSLNGSKIESSVANSEKQLIKIQGTLTSSLQLKGEGTKEPYQYAFVKLKGQTVDLPVIFKIKDKLSLKRGELVELSGNYSNSTKSIRKSFTAYQILNGQSLDSFDIKLSEKRIKKKTDRLQCEDKSPYCKTCYLANQEQND